MSGVTRSRVLALGVLTALVAVVGVAVAYPVAAHYQELGATIADKRHQLDRYRALAAQQDALSEQLATVRRSGAASSYYVTGATSALASATMQRQLKQTAQRSGGEVSSTQILRPDDDAANPRASLRAHLRLDTASLLRVVHALESGQPMYFIDNLLIDARPARARSGSKVVETIQLDVKFDLHGYVAREAQ